MAAKKTKPAARPAVAAEPDFIQVRGAREHNLHIDELTVPKRQLVVFTGVSGSGKSSLAFDTLYAEGQRRYVESLSSYARQFLGQMEKPKYESLRGLSPTIAIEQKSASSNPRSTVGTVTEIYDYLRVFYTRVGDQRCHLCGGAVSARSAAEIVDELLTLPPQTKAVLMARKADNRKGEFRDVFDEARKAGFARVRINGTVQRLDEVRSLDKNKKHTVDIVVDRVTLEASSRARITDSVESALKEGAGVLVVEVEGERLDRMYSESRACGSCGASLPELSPQSFSFNSPLGMCIDCNGLGSSLEVDPELVVPDPSLSIGEGAIEPWGEKAGNEKGWTASIAKALNRQYAIPLDKPWKNLTARQREIVLFGNGDDERLDVKWKGANSTGSWAMKFSGVVNTIKRRLQDTQSEMMRQWYTRYFRETECRACKGQRLRPESRAVCLGEKSIVDVTSMTVVEAARHFETLKLKGAKAQIAEEILKEIRNRLGFLLNVGLEYLTLDRGAATLSGGEAQRIRLASQLGSELSGVMYVLDEPSIGLHQRDNRRLIETLRRLRDLGNSVLVVEHDQETIEAADWVIDFGPGAGRLGGHVVAEGTPAQVAATKKSLTGRYLCGAIEIEVPKQRRKPVGFLKVKGAREHNLKNIDVNIPLGVLAAVTGVSGAGKSSLVDGILRPALRRKLLGALDPVGKFDGLEGVEQIDKIIDIDQKPIGRTPRSNPATYTKAFDLIRDIFAETPEARAFGYKPGRFSFNVKGGRCEACEGDGVRKVEMHFLPDVYVTCEVCRGQRYNEATLRVKWKGLSIAEVLDTSVADARPLFENHRQLKAILQTLDDVGLGYIHLGQSATTLSGGEAQRIKLSRELAKRDTGKTLYLLDEPTTGLHFEDVRRLLIVLGRLVEPGNTVLVIEHNLDVIKAADFLIDIGPEGGAAGGQVVAFGTPEDVAKVRGSYTGQFLAPLLAKHAKATKAPAAKPTGRTKPSSVRA
ncbi:MAG: excinuclease ABC subunit UvrA [Deltaproteobacteria bacterium]|nr:excinuclease ABC subunit UvrA [Deltaproteobacteria bacterium]